MSLRASVHVEKKQCLPINPAVPGMRSACRAICVRFMASRPNWTFDHPIVRPFYLFLPWWWQRLLKRLLTQCKKTHKILPQMFTPSTYCFFEVMGGWWEMPRMCAATWTDIFRCVSRLPTICPPPALLIISVDITWRRRRFLSFVFFPIFHRRTERGIGRGANERTEH